MSRKLPRAFFWIDQEIIRSGLWLKLSPAARLAYLAIVATCDRQGVSIWSRNKLMELSSCSDPEDWYTKIVELETHRLIETLQGHSPPAIRVIELTTANTAAVDGTSPRSSSSSDPHPSRQIPPIVVHTHTTIHLGEKSNHVEPRNSD
jgi:hypothetical protein